MVYSTPNLGTHPVLDTLRGIHEAIDELAMTIPSLLDTETRADILVTLDFLEERIGANKLHLMSLSTDLAVRDGHRDIASWMAQTLHKDTPATRRDHRLATALEQRWHHTGTALLAGGLNKAQAQVITDVLDQLPTDQLGPDAPALLEKAELHLLDQARHFGPKALKRLGNHLLEVLDPDLAEEVLRRRLEAEERDALITTTLSLRDRGDGTTTLRGRIPTTAAARLKLALEALTSPRNPLNQELARQQRAERDEWEAAQAQKRAQAAQAGFAHPDSVGDLETLAGAHSSTTDGSSTTDAAPAGEAGRLPYAQRLGRAFVSLLERIAGKDLPVHGGTNTQLVVTIDHETLRTGLGTATTNTGHDLSPSEARRLACNAAILPAVLDGTSRPLDLGRSQRLYNTAQRTALALRDRGCRGEGCDIPAAWTEAHHLTPWSRGGKTDLDHGVLLCSYHHHRAHDPTYRTDRLPNGDIRFTRRE